MIRSSYATVMLALAMVSACGSNSGEPAATATPEPTPTTSVALEELEEAANICGNRKYGNEFMGKNALVQGSRLFTMDDKTLIIDGYGDQFASAPAAGCILGSIGAPDAIVSQVESTTAMMGRQTDSFDGYELTWSFHPDNGMDMIVEVTD